MKNIVEISNISKQYKNGVWGIRDLSLDIPNGKMILLAGENGAGKTTLINMLVGLIFPSCGTIEYSGEYLSDRLFSNVGFCNQILSIDWYLNVYDNVLMGALLAGYYGNEASKRTKDTLKLFNLYGKRKMSVEQLSGGQQQQVQVARAIVHDPRIMILDEPIVGIDLTLCHDIMKFFKHLVISQNKTIIISSHQLSVVENYCDEIIFLSKGQLIEHSSLSTFRSHYDNMIKYIIDFEEANINVSNIEKFIQLKKSERPLEIVVTRDLNVSQIIGMIGADKLRGIKSDELTLEDMYMIHQGREKYNHGD